VWRWAGGRQSSVHFRVAQRLLLAPAPVAGGRLRLGRRRWPLVVVADVGAHRAGLVGAQASQERPVGVLRLGPSARQSLQGRRGCRPLERVRAQAGSSAGVPVVMVVVVLLTRLVCTRCLAGYLLVLVVAGRSEAPDLARVLWRLCGQGALGQVRVDTAEPPLGRRPRKRRPTTRLNLEMVVVVLGRLMGRKACQRAR
jgi:hypothetical protein